MPRGRQEQYSQDRVGTVVRNLDPYRASDGMDADNGFVQVAAGDVGTDLIVHEIPDSAHGVVLEEIHAHNASDTEATFRVIGGETTVDGNGDTVIDTSSIRSVLYNVPPAGTRTLPYIGRGFEKDYLGVMSNFEGEIAFGVYNDHREYEEPATEQREA